MLSKTFKNSDPTKIVRINTQLEFFFQIFLFIFFIHICFVAVKTCVFKPGPVYRIMETMDDGVLLEVCQLHKKI